MQSFLQNLPHLIMATLVISAAATLAALGVISGTEAITVIVGVGGFSLGVGGSSTSLSAVVSATRAASPSTGGSIQPSATVPPITTTTTTAATNGQSTPATDAPAPMSAGA